MKIDYFRGSPFARIHRLPATVFVGLTLTVAPVAQPRLPTPETAELLLLESPQDYQVFQRGADPVNAVPPPPSARGYPSRDPDLDAWPGFQNPPPGYGEVPFWWWTGDPLQEERLLWQLDQLHQKGISGVQVNYAHQDTPGWPTYPAEPPLFSERWWEIWGRVADACRQRGMGIGLSTYTLDWPGADNLFRQRSPRAPNSTPSSSSPCRPPGSGKANPSP